MKRTLKLVLIFAGSLIGIIVGSLTGYFIISNNKTYYIYDVRLVEPVDGMAGYIYTDEETDYTSIKNQTVYMQSQSTNIYPIAVYVLASSNSSDVKITSSDSSIAKIVYKDGKCYVQYLKEGLVTISSELAGVKDSFNIQIYDQLPSSFNVYDNDYYGDYASIFPNTIVSYADDTEYRYKYVLNNASSTGNNSNIDGELIRLDKSNLDETIFDKDKTRIDASTNELVVKCKIPATSQKDNMDSTLVLQSFYYTDDGEVVVENNYIVKVHIVLYIPEFLQIEVSGTPDFDEGTVFVNTTKIDVSSLTTAAVLADPSLLDNYLSSEKAETYLEKNGENATYGVFLTEKVSRLYLRFRMVYTNGDIVYLKSGENASFTFSNNSLCEIGPTDDYYIMTLNETNYFTSPSEIYEIEISLSDFVFNHTFSFEYRDLTSSNVSDFYSYDSETGIYTYKYWDERTHFDNEIYDAGGNVVGFGE